MTEGQYIMKQVFKGFIVCILVFSTGYLIWEKSFPTVSQTAMGVTKWQSKRIEYLLKENLSYKCEEIEKTNINNSMLEDLEEGYEAYTASDKNGKQYILIINKKRGSLSCVLSMDYRLEYGLMDSGILPSYFVNGKPWYEN